MLDPEEEKLRLLEKDWSAAIVRNDADAIGRFMSEDWVIVGPEGNVIDKARFLAVIRSGGLVHQSMESEDDVVRVYGEAAIVTARTKTKASYKGQSFVTDERSSSVYIRKNSQWQCVYTQLTPISKGS